MSGLFALLDDVAAIAKVAAASVDDIAAYTAKAGSKAAGIVIDDAAVTPKYVTGFEPARELPIIWKIAKGSVFNKLVLLLPAALLLASLAPWLIPPLLILGGAYLSYEGAEKVLHWLAPGAHGAEAEVAGTEVGNPAKLEEAKVKGAIKTDFILSAEIMTIALSTIDVDVLWLQAVVLALVGLAITAGVYGVVAVIVKMDDIGLWLGRVGRLGATRALGRGIVKVMPWFLKGLTLVGTVAMLWVGGSIILHSAHQMGWHAPEDMVHAAAHAVGQGQGGVEWIVTAALDLVLGLILGGFLVQIVARFLDAQKGESAH